MIRPLVLNVLVVALVLLVAGPSWGWDDAEGGVVVAGADGVVSLNAAKKKKKDNVVWTPIMEISGTAPADAGAIYVGSKDFKITQQALRITVKMTSLVGGGGSVSLTLYKTNRPTKKIPIMRLSRAGEKVVAIRVHPGLYKIDYKVNNVNVSIKIDQGKKKGT